MNNIEYRHDDLTQVSETEYTIGNSTIVTRTLVLDMPPMTTPKSWERYQLSLEDIIELLDSISIRSLWQFAILIGITIPNSCIKPTCSQVTSTVIVSKSNVMVDLGKAIGEEIYSKSSRRVKSKLEKNHKCHVPPVSVQSVGSETYEEWKKVVQSATKIKYIRENNVDHIIYWKNIPYLPVSITSDMLIYMIRIFDVDVYEQSRDPKLFSHLSRPISIVYNGKQMYASIEDAVYFKP